MGSDTGIRNLKLAASYDFSLAGIVGSARVDNQRTKAADHAYIARYAGPRIQVMCRLGRTAGKLDPAICATGEAASMCPAARKRQNPLRDVDRTGIVEQAANCRLVGAVGGSG